MMGNGAYGVAVFETVPSVNPAQIYAAGYQLVGSGERAFVDRLIEDVPANQPQTTPFTGATQWDSAFGDADGWGLSSTYGTTVMFADINGDGMADVCGRGQAGIYCELSTGGGFGALYLAQGAFADANGSNLANYYASLRFADVNGDGKPDICDRGQAGIYCVLNAGGGAFGGLQLWDSIFSDANGYNLPQYGNTVMFADINGDRKADVCVRGLFGIWCELSTGTVFGPPFLAQSDFSDIHGWGTSDYYSSLRFADVNGDGTPDVCGRGQAGIYCALNAKNERSTPLRSGIPTSVMLMVGASPNMEARLCSPTSMPTARQMFVEGEGPESGALCPAEAASKAPSWRNTTSPMPKAGTSLHITVRCGLPMSMATASPTYAAAELKETSVRSLNSIARSTADQAGNASRFSNGYGRHTFILPTDLPQNSHLLLI